MLYEVITPPAGIPPGGFLAGVSLAATRRSAASAGAKVATIQCRAAPDPLEPKAGGHPYLPGAVGGCPAALPRGALPIAARWPQMANGIV